MHNVDCREQRMVWQENKNEIIVSIVCEYRRRYTLFDWRYDLFWKHNVVSQIAAPVAGANF